MEEGTKSILGAHEPDGGKCYMEGGSFCTEAAGWWWTREKENPSMHACMDDKNRKMREKRETLCSATVKPLDSAPYVHKHTHIMQYAHGF